MKDRLVDAFVGGTVPLVICMHAVLHDFQFGPHEVEMMFKLCEKYRADVLLFMCSVVALCA